MRKWAVVLTIIVSLLVGAAGGFGGAYYHYVVGPQKKAQEMAKRQQEELNRMVRHGEVVAVEPEKVIVHVTKAQVDQGKTKTYLISEYTSVQIGMNFVNKPGEKTDLTKWFQKGDEIDLLVKDDQAMAVHRELRPGEQVPQASGQVGAQGAEGQVSSSSAR